MTSAKDLALEAFRLQLKGWEAIRGMSVEELEEAYNGIGPDSWPAGARERLSEKFPFILPAVLLHDVEFRHSDGSRVKFRDANSNFRDNARICADDAFGWYDLRRYQARIGGELAYKGVSSDFGWNAWLDAARKNGINVSQETERKGK